MIGYLKGIIVHAGERELIVLTEGGTGYLVTVTPSLASAHQSGDSIELFIETAVREDAIVLFGFRRLEEKNLFNMLREVNKIGPKTSLSILSAATVEEISYAIVSGNSGFFKKISGVGPKTAEKIIIDLKDKVSFDSSSVESSEINETERQTVDARDGLLALGYNPLQVRNALNRIDGKDGMRAEQIVREALRIINGKR